LKEIPPEVEEERWTMMGRDGLLEYMGDQAERAEGLGAAAIVFSSGSPDDPGPGLHYFPLRRSYRKVGIPVLEVAGEAMSNLVAADQGESAACSVIVAIEPRTIKVKNVIGTKRGTSRADEYVVVGAHYDHLGYGDIASSTPWRREIHNGADDNASGVASLIETANWMANKGPQDRSVVFVAFTAEELGALGSEYYCEHPPFPIESTIAMINLDTIGRVEDNEVIVFGALSAEEMSGLLQQANKEPIPSDRLCRESHVCPFKH
jgi:acetylornithine deacetylase/succinyl-diaminopimelate desuccinylase-like protein